MLRLQVILISTLSAAVKLNSSVVAVVLKSLTGLMAVTPGGV